MKGALVFALLAALTASGMARAQEPGARIETLLANIRSEPDGDARGKLAAGLAEYVAAQGNGATQLDACSIDDIAALLSDAEDWVRFYAAAALGFVGPEARRALPQLERALDRAKTVASLGADSPGVFAGLGSANAICAAIGKIDLGLRPRACENYR